MDYNVVFKLSKDVLIISKIIKDVDYKSLNNTNVINLKDLKFSKSYIEANLALVSNFINLVVIKNNITTLQINNLEIAEVGLIITNDIKEIKKIIFKPDKKVNFNIFLHLLDNNYIQEIECFEMYDYLIERLDLLKSIKVTTRNKIEINSKFMVINNLKSYSDIYYKKYIVISFDLIDNDLEDFKNFMRINAKLKTIKIVKYANETITSVVDEIIETKKKNILIETNEFNNDLDVIYKSVNYLKKKFRKYFDENNIKFKLNYSNNYKSNNFFKEINFKMCMASIICVIVFSIIVVIINCYTEYQDREKIENQLQDLEIILKDAEEYFGDSDKPDLDVEIIDVEDNTTTTTKKKSNYVSSYYTNFEQVFDKLLQKNNDTVGWLQVNNTKINYPVVKSDTNSYYLNRDYFKKKNSMGWIFMDYRNSIDELDRNTIIYGHNIKQGIMFGTIKNMMNSNWYNNPKNTVITFNTLNKNMKWMIFSLYQINETEDYLKTEFANDQEYVDFLQMLTNRSKKNFNVPLNANSKILTLSTCFSHTTRHVVHAVLIEEENEGTEEINNPE